MLQKNALYVGSFNYYKKHKTAIKIAEKQKLKLTLVGNGGEDLDNIKNLGKQKLKNKFKIIAWANNRQLKKIYKESSIYIAPQTTEPFGISTLKAKSGSLYTIGINSGGTPEIIQHNIDGYLIPNIKKEYFFSKKIKEKQNKLSSNTIDWNETAQKIKQIIIKIMENESSHN